MTFSADRTPPPSLPVLPATNQQMQRHSRMMLAFSWALTCCAVVASALWGPVLVAVAEISRPYQLDHPNEYPDEVYALAHLASVRMWTLLIASFVALLVMAMLAIVMGRKARSTAGNWRAPDRLEVWAAGSLLLGLVFSFATITSRFSLSIALNRSVASAASITFFAMAGAMASFILSGIALRKIGTAVPGRASARRALRQYGTRISLVVALLVLLAGFYATWYQSLITATFFSVF